MQTVRITVSPNNILLMKKGCPITLATKHPFYSKSNDDIIYLRKLVYVFLCEVHHNFSITVNIFEDQVKVF